MDMPARVRRVVSAALIAAALVAAFILGRITRPSAPAWVAAAAPTPPTPPAVAPARPALPPDSPVASLPSEDKATIHALGELARLRNRYPNAVQLPVLTRRDRVEDAFATLLGLDSAQVNVLNVAIYKARQKLNALAAQHAQLAVGGAGEIVISIPPLEGGAAVYDELMDTFAGTLGQERMEAFKVLLGEQLAETFQNFGAERKVLTIAENLPGFVDWKDGGFYLKEDRWTQNGKLETSSFRFLPDRMQFLFPQNQWIAPLIAGKLPPASYPVNVPEE